MTKITALNNGALKLLSDHSIYCNLDHGACDYPYCKEAKRLLIKNAMSGEKRLSLIQQIQLKRETGRRGILADSSRRDDDDTSTSAMTRNSGRSSGSSSTSSAWKRRSRVQTDTLVEDGEEGQEIPTDSK